MQHGFLVIDKPAGPTSHDLVAQVRRLSAERRVGHAGTLDPAATGVLVVALGQATRLIEYVQEQTSKRYHAIVELGRTTTTDDAEGTVLMTEPVPALDEAALGAVLQQFQGLIEQVPPQYSAIHHQGQRMHELARAGVQVDLPARQVYIDQLRLLGWQPPMLTLDVTCSKGTYIRALARDLGVALGCGAHLHSLRRTAVGQFMIDQAVSLEQLQAGGRAVLLERLLPPVVAVADWPALAVDPPTATLIRNGMAIPRNAAQHQRTRAMTSATTLLALLVADGDCWRPTKVFDWT